jgi:integrase/recombinase XerD
MDWDMRPEYFQGILCRCSELVALRAEGIILREYGARILVRRAKNDPFGNGRTAAISSRSLRILTHWLDTAGIEKGPIFRPVMKGVVLSRFLHPFTVTRVLKRTAERADVCYAEIRQISSHSMREGAVQDLILNGHNILMIMAAGGWRSINVVGRYVENVDLRIWD